jgi:hypothetical protein
MVQRLSYIFATGLLLLIAVPVFASGSSTFEITEESSEVERGGLFDVIIRLHSNSESVDTARAMIGFDPSMLSVQAVQLIGDLDRSAPGNYWDNVQGVISWGGFTLDGAVDSSSDFIVITFLALQEGETSFSLKEGSKIIAQGEERIDVSQFVSSDITIDSASEVDSGVALLVLESETHPDENAWTQETTAVFRWIVLQGEHPLSGLYYDLDRSSDTHPTTFIDPDITSWNVKDLEDGIHYFHLRGVHEDGRETSVEHYRVKVDTTAPNPIILVVQDQQVVEGESLWFTFATTDETSGVAQYQVAINESEYQVQASPLEVTDLNAGTYFFRVAALDRAGNASYEGVSVRVYPEGTVLDRPEGYEKNTEINAVTTATKNKDLVDTENSTWKRLLIAVIVLMMIILGFILYRKRAS